jgi:hypothetical protein
MTTLKYQVCNLIIKQNDKGRFSPEDIAKDMINFYAQKLGDISTTEFMSFLLNSLEKEKNELLKLFITYTLNFYMMLELYSREDSEEKEKLMEMAKPNVKGSFENITNFLKSKDCKESLEELSVTHQIVKSLNE